MDSIGPWWPPTPDDPENGPTCDGDCDRCCATAKQCAQTEVCS